MLRQATTSGFYLPDMIALTAFFIYRKLSYMIAITH